MERKTQLAELIKVDVINAKNLTLTVKILELHLWDYWNEIFESLLPDGYEYAFFEYKSTSECVYEIVFKEENFATALKAVRKAYCKANKTTCQELKETAKLQAEADDVFKDVLPGFA